MKPQGTDSDPASDTAGSQLKSSNGDPHFLLWPRVAVESIAEKSVVLYDADRSSRLKLTRSLYEVVRRFSRPTRLQDVIPEGAAAEPVTRCLQTLIEKGYLYQQGHPRIDGHQASTFTTIPATLFRCPRVGSEQAPPDVGIIGVPFDLGVASWPGARGGPAAIRERSADSEYQRDVVSGRAVGWFDVQRRQRILEGVSFADYGDVRVQYGEPITRIHARIADACSTALDQETFPVFLGGDHSITYPIVRLLQERTPLCVVYFDAHTDSAPLAGDIGPNAINVGRALLSLPNVRRLIQVGHRGYTLNNKLETGTDRHQIVTVWELRETGPETVISAMPEHYPCYVSIDINCLDPAYAPATNTPSPDGLSLQEFKTAVRALGQARRILGLDLCEVNPDRAPVLLTAKSACHMLLAALSSFEHQWNRDTGNVPLGPC